MNLQTIAINTLWGGVFAGSLAVRLTAPRRYLVTSFLAGAAGRFVFDILKTLNNTEALATGMGAMAVVLVARLAFAGRESWQVVVISGVLPLAAGSAMVRAMWHLLELGSLQGEAHAKAIEASTADASQVVVVSAAIVAGATIGLILMRLLRREELFERA